MAQEQNPAYEILKATKQKRANANGVSTPPAAKVEANGGISNPAYEYLKSVKAKRAAAVPPKPQFDPNNPSPPPLAGMPAPPKIGLGTQALGAMGGAMTGVAEELTAPILPEMPKSGTPLQVPEAPELGTSPEQPINPVLRQVYENAVRPGTSPAMMASMIATSGLPGWVAKAIGAGFGIHAISTQLEQDKADEAKIAGYEATSRYEAAAGNMDASGKALYEADQLRAKRVINLGMGAAMMTPAATGIGKTTYEGIGKGVDKFGPQVPTGTSAEDASILGTYSKKLDDAYNAQPDPAATQPQGVPLNMSTPKDPTMTRPRRGGTMDEGIGPNQTPPAGHKVIYPEVSGETSPFEPKVTEPAKPRSRFRQQEPVKPQSEAAPKVEPKTPPAGETPETPPVANPAYEYLKKVKQNRVEASKPTEVPATPTTTVPDQTNAMSPQMTPGMAPSEPKSTQPLPTGRDINTVNEPQRGTPTSVERSEAAVSPAAPIKPDLNAVANYYVEQFKKHSENTPIDRLDPTSRVGMSDLTAKFPELTIHDRVELQPLIDQKMKAAGLANAHKPTRFPSRKKVDVSTPPIPSFHSNDQLITAYHGSPHTFDRFDLHKIGTGEGNQAYSWGLYFAGDRSVAEYYQHTLSNSGNRKKDLWVNSDGRTANGIEIAKEYYKPGRLIPTYKGSEWNDKVISYRDDYFGSPYGVVTVQTINKAGKSVSEPRETLAYPSNDLMASALAKDGWTPTSISRLYKVDLPKKSEYLDWDRPIREQDPRVQKAVQALASVKRSDIGARSPITDMTGREIYKTLAWAYGIEGKISHEYDGPKGEEIVSRELAKLGVPGMKFLNGSSRTLGQGEHNYVIFDDNLIRNRESGRALPSAAPGVTPSTGGPKPIAEVRHYPKHGPVIWASPDVIRAMYEAGTGLTRENGITTRGFYSPVGPKKYLNAMSHAGQPSDPTATATWNTTWDALEKVLTEHGDKPFRAVSHPRFVGKRKAIDVFRHETTHAQVFDKVIFPDTMWNNQSVAHIGNYLAAGAYKAFAGNKDLLSHEVLAHVLSGELFKNLAEGKRGVPVIDMGYTETARNILNTLTAEIAKQTDPDTVIDLLTNKSPKIKELRDELIEQAKEAKTIIEGSVRQSDFPGGDVVASDASQEGDHSRGVRPTLPSTGGEATPAEQPLASHEDTSPMLAKITRNGETRAAAKTDPRLMQILNKYGSDLGKVIAKETLQNSIDAVSLMDDKGEVSVDFDSDTKTFTITDNGEGMTQDIVLKEFVDPGGSVKPENSVGGFGIAKVAIFSNAEQIHMESVAKAANGRKYKTTATGSGLDWLDSEKGFLVKHEPVAFNTPTGTILKIKVLPEVEADDYSIKKYFRQFLDKQQLPTKFKLTIDGGEVGKSYDNRPVKLIHSGETSGTKYDVYVSDDVVEQSWSNVDVLNGGMPQFSYETYYGKDVKAPVKIAVNFKPTVKATAANYPFKLDREGLQDKAKEAIDDWLKKNVVEASIRGEHEKYTATLTKARKLPSGNYKVMDTEENVPEDLLKNISNSWAIDNVATKLGRIFKDAQKELAKLDPIYNHATFDGIGLGSGYYGINIHGAQIKGDVTDKNIILINPFALSEHVQSLVDSGFIMESQKASQLSKHLISTMIHELTHQPERNHEATKFLAKFGRNIAHIMDQSFYSAKELEKSLYDRVYKEIERFRDELSIRTKGTDVFGKIGLDSSTTSPGGPTGDTGHSQGSQGGGSGLQKGVPGGGNNPAEGVAKPKATRFGSRVAASGEKGSIPFFKGKKPQQPLTPNPWYDNILKDRAKSEEGPTFLDRFFDSAHQLTLDYYDKFDDLHQTTKEAADKGLIWTGSEDPYKVAAIVYGGWGGPIEMALKGVGDVSKEMEKEGILNHFTNWIDINAYMREWDKVKDSVNKLTAKINNTPTHKDVQKWKDLRRILQTNIRNNDVAPGSISERQLALELKDVEKQLTPSQLTKIKAGAQKIYDQTANALERLHQWGLVTDEAYNEMKLFPNHISLKRIVDGLGDLGKQYTASAFNVRKQNVIKGMKGSRLSNVDPLKATALYLAAAERLIGRQWSARTIVNFRNIDPGAPITELLGNAKASHGNGTISYLDKGVARHFEVPKSWEDAVQVSNAAEINLIGKTVLQFSRDLLQKTATGWNAAFIAKNFIRDSGDMRTFTPGFRPYNPIDETKIALLYADTVRKMLKDPKFREAYMRSGVAYATFQRNYTPEEFLNADKIFNGPGGKIKKVFHDLASFNSFMEESFKATAWRWNYLHGMDPIDSIYFARRAGSPDFGQSGLKSKQMGLIAPFFNPSIQGSARSLKFVSGQLENPRTGGQSVTPVGIVEKLVVPGNPPSTYKGSNLKKLAWALGGMALVAAVKARYNSQYLNDDDGLPEVAHEPDSQRKNYDTWYLPITFNSSKGEVRHMAISIPKTQLEQMMKNPLDIAFNEAMGIEYTSPTQAALSIMSSIMPGQFDLKEKDFFSSLGYGFLGSLSPIIKELPQQIANKDFVLDAPLVSKGQEGLDPHMQFRPTTATWAVDLAKKLAHYDVELSPVRLEHLTNAAITGVGEQASTMADFTLEMAKNRPDRSYPVEGPEAATKLPFIGPIIRPFLGSIQDARVQKMEKDFYDSFAEADQATQSLNEAVKTANNDYKETINYINKVSSNPRKVALLSLNGNLSTMAKALTDVHKAMTAVSKSNVLSDDGKKATMSKLHKGYIILLKHSQIEVELVTKRLEDDKAKGDTTLRDVIIKWITDKVEDDLGLNKLSKPEK